MVTWTFEELDEVGSTQAIAKGLASMGAAEGTTVVAKSQSSGAGRLGRAWISPAGGLYMSFVLRPGNIPRPELITLVSAVAVVEGVKRATGLRPSIRWPNDVMVNGKKLAGVIADAQSFKQEVTQIIVGVGVNCNASVSELAALHGEGTSIEEELGKKVEVSELRHAILDSFSGLYDRWKAAEDLRPVWQGQVATLGREVSIKLKTEENPFACTAREIDADGNLVVSREGEAATIRPEDLEWLREQA
ncbi:MAG: biotin--[acetyl-CoA-carboxylase] ligase [Thaumarchaeota archaeon]|nr:biotin--[acetyl-CoA-carboxylase] ligase [Nitrososphaerota archaeon]